MFHLWRSDVCVEYSPQELVLMALIYRLLLGTDPLSWENIINGRIYEKDEAYRELDSCITKGDGVTGTEWLEYQEVIC
jgi:hypothetical protein